MPFAHMRVGSARFQVSVSSFEEFKQYIETEIPSGEVHVFRGHLSSEWQLQPSILRGLAIVNDDPLVKQLADDQLRFFKEVAGEFTDLKPDDPDDTWWAYGQHMGLNTPLLDWSTSPYVALFFAFADVDEYQHYTEERVVYVLNRTAIETKNDKSPFEPGDRDYLLEFIDPPRDSNPRLVSQDGLLTIAPKWARIDDMVEMDFEDEKHRRVLTRILIPDKERVSILTALNDMGINHRKIFPDATGAAKYCNLLQDLRRAVRPKPALPATVSP